MHAQCIIYLIHMQIGIVLIPILPPGRSIGDLITSVLSLFADGLVISVDAYAYVCEEEEMQGTF